MTSISNPLNVKKLSGQKDCSRIFFAAVGDTPNDQVKLCRICKDRGYPHESIKFRTINDGRLKGDNSYEFKTYQILNYADDTPHECRPYNRSSPQ